MYATNIDGRFIIYNGIGLNIHFLMGFFRIYLKGTFNNP